MVQYMGTAVAVLLIYQTSNVVVAVICYDCFSTTSTVNSECLTSSASSMFEVNLSTVVCEHSCALIGTSTGNIQRGCWFEESNGCVEDEVNEHYGNDYIHYQSTYTTCFSTCSSDFCNRPNLTEPQILLGNLTAPLEVTMPLPTEVIENTSSELVIPTLSAHNQVTCYDCSNQHGENCVDPREETTQKAMCEDHQPYCALVESRSAEVPGERGLYMRGCWQQELNECNEMWCVKTCASDLCNDFTLRNLTSPGDKNGSGGTGIGGDSSELLTGSTMTTANGIIAQTISLAGGDMTTENGVVQVESNSSENNNGQYTPSSHLDGNGFNTAPVSSEKNCQNFFTVAALFIFIAFVYE